MIGTTKRLWSGGASARGNMLSHAITCAVHNIVAADAPPSAALARRHACSVQAGRHAYDAADLRCSPFPEPSTLRSEANARSLLTARQPCAEPACASDRSAAQPSCSPFSVSGQTQHMSKSRNNRRKARALPERRRGAGLHPAGGLILFMVCRQQLMDAAVGACVPRVPAVVVAVPASLLGATNVAGRALTKSAATGLRLFTCRIKLQRGIPACAGPAGRRLWRCCLLRSCC